MIIYFYRCFFRPRKTSKEKPSILPLLHKTILGFPLRVVGNCFIFYFFRENMRRFYCVIESCSRKTECFIYIYMSERKTFVHRNLLLRYPCSFDLRQKLTNLLRKGLYEPVPQKGHPKKAHQV